MNPDKQGSPTGPRAVDGEAATFRQVLLRLRYLIPRSLLDSPAWDRLLDRTADLPVEGARFFGFEFRLGDPVPAADFIVRVQPRSSLAEHYIRRGEAAAPSSAEASFARCLTELPVDRAGNLIDLALEYDIAEVPSGQHPAPGVFMKLLPPAGAGDVMWLGTVTAALADAAGWLGDAGERRAVERVFNALPPGGRICFLGAFPGRGVRAVRIMVDDLEEPDVRSFLQRLDWQGPVNAVPEILADLQDVVFPNDFQLAIDVVAAGVLPRLGLEVKCPFPEDGAAWTKTTRRDWIPLVTRLAERGWCLPEKAHGLLAYPGQEIFTDRTGGFYLAYKGISHIKLSIGEGDISAKAYTGLSFGRHNL